MAKPGSYGPVAAVDSGLNGVSSIPALGRAGAAFTSVLAGGAHQKQELQQPLGLGKYQDTDIVFLKIREIRLLVGGSKVDVRVKMATLFLVCSILVASLSCQAFAGDVFRRIRKEAGWQLPVEVAGCPSGIERVEEIRGIPLRVLELDKKCLAKQDVIEEVFYNDNGLAIRLFRYRIIGGTKFERKGKTVMIKLLLAPVLGGGEGQLSAVAGAAFQYYYVDSKGSGFFDLRIEALTLPELPDWVSNVKP